MSGVALSAFLDWSTNSGPQYLSGPNHIINDVAAESYLFGEMMRGKTPDQLLQGSNKLKETVFLEGVSTFQTFKRGADVVFLNPQKDVTLELQWRFMLDYMSWDEAEYLLQSSSASGRDGLKTMYKQMAYSKEQRQMQSTIDGMEDLLWANPSGASQFAEMEAAGGQTPYSLPVFVHENGSNNGGFDSNWTTTELITQATYAANWDNYRAQYDYTDPLDTDGDLDGLFDMFEETTIKTKFKKPTLPNSSTSDKFEPEAKRSGSSICTSTLGKKLVCSLNRQSNDSLINPNDAYYGGNPSWNGIPIMQVAALDTAALYDDGASGYTTEAAATNAGPRFYFFQWAYLNWRFHRAKYFQKREKKEPINKIGVFIHPVEIWGNLTCTSRRRQAICYPGA